MNKYSLKRFVFLFMNFDYCCCFCGETDNLNCHHIIIQDIGNSRGSYYRLKDLKLNYLNIILLCPKCHCKLHKLIEVL